MKKTIIALIILIVLAGASYYGYIQYQIKIDHAPILSALKDADSAKFKSEHKLNGYLCGEVNAKNAMGAYVGFKRFISYKDGYAIDGSQSPASTLFTDEDGNTNALITHIEMQTKVLKEAIKLQKISYKNGLDYEIPNKYELEDKANSLEFQTLWDKHC